MLICCEEENLEKIYKVRYLKKYKKKGENDK